MAMRSFGLSFMPGAEQNGKGARTANGGAPRNPVQEAIEVLSLRLPKVFGARAIAPASLLTAPGGMGQPAARGNVSAQALAALAGRPPTLGPPPMMPAPVVPPMPAPSASGDAQNWADWIPNERALSRPQPETQRAPTATPAPAPSPPPALTPPPRIGVGQIPDEAPPGPPVSGDPFIFGTRTPVPASTDLAAIRRMAEQFFLDRNDDPYGGFTGGGF